MKPIRVLIVDDSALIRKVLTEIINSDDRFECIGTASNPLIAREKIKQLNPDVITLDVEMPKMDGVTFLKNLMRLRPMPVIMISTLTQKGADITLDALEIGAIDCIAKPNLGDPKALDQERQLILEKLYLAAFAKVRPFDPNKFDSRIKATPLSVRWNSQSIIALGASTGGTEAIKKVLIGLPSNMPPIVIAQHIPPMFSSSFAQRMDRTCELNVVEAEHGMTLKPGFVYIAPGDKHLELNRTTLGLTCEVKRQDPVNRHVPSVDVLLDSVVSQCGSKALGIILTGMGADGAKALLRMKEKGCETIVQDEASSVVWGMPKAAFELGAANKVISLEKIPGAMVQWANA